MIWSIIGKITQFVYNEENFKFGICLEKAPQYTNNTTPKVDSKHFL